MGAVSVFKVGFPQEKKIATNTRTFNSITSMSFFSFFHLI